MTLYEQSGLIAILAIVAYIIVGGVLLFKGSLIRAGLSISAISFMPFTWQVIATESDAPGFAFLLVLMLPLALAIILAGLAWWIFQRLNRSKPSGL